MIKEYEVRLSMILYRTVEEGDPDLAKERAIELFLDDLQDPRNREEWREALDTDVSW